MSQGLVNANPVVYQVAASKRSTAPEDLNDEVRDSIDNQEIFGIFLSPFYFTLIYFPLRIFHILLPLVELKYNKIFLKSYHRFNPVHQ